MEAVQKKVENQIQFWTLLGPFFVLLSITALLFKMSPHWYFPLSALIGIPLCVRWKMKGMTGALGCLFLLAGINSQSLDLTDQYWHVGLSLAMAFSFIILTLSLEESDGLVTKVQVESQSRLDNFLLLDEKWKSAEAEWAQQKEEIEAEVSDLTRQLAKLLEEKQVFYKLAQLAKDELIQIRGQHEQLLQDLLYKKEQVAQLYERLDENEQTIQNFVNSDPERKIQILANQMTILEKEREVFKAQIALAKEERESYRIDKERVEEERDVVQVENMRLLEEQEVCNRERECIEQEKIALKRERETLENETSSILTERETDFKALKLQKIRSEQLVLKVTDELRRVEKRAEQISCELSEQQALAQQANQEKDRLSQENYSLQQALHQKGEEEKNGEKEVATHGKFIPPAHACSSEARAIEFMYKQLKKQFQEKSEVLDATRRELFAVNEELLKMRRQNEEESLYSYSREEKGLQDYVIQLGKQFEQMEANFQQEVDDLMQLVGDLLNHEVMHESNVLEPV